jgi:hypothetical protein
MDVPEGQVHYEVVPSGGEDTNAPITTPEPQTTPPPPAPAPAGNP